MAEALSPPPPIIPEAGYPPPNVVTVYADGVTSFSPGTQTIKFYLSRLEPNFVASEPTKAIVTGQVIMPLAGFVATAHFFQKILSILIENGTLTKEQVDQMIESVNK